MMPPEIFFPVTSNARYLDEKECLRSLAEMKASYDPSRRMSTWDVARSISELLDDWNSGGFGEGIGIGSPAGKPAGRDTSGAALGPAALEPGLIGRDASEAALGPAALEPGLIGRIAATTGLHEKMVAFCLNQGFSAWKDGLIRCQNREKTTLENALDLFSNTGYAPTCSGEKNREGPNVLVTPPELLFICLSGNVFTIALDSVFQALLWQCPTLIKCSSRESHLAIALASALGKRYPELIKHLAIAVWSGEEHPEMSHLAVREAWASIVYGSDETVDSLYHSSSHHQRFLGFGHKISLAIILAGKGSLVDEGVAKYHGTGDQRIDTEPRARMVSLARGLALDVSLFDQLGCMSPHVVYVEQNDQWSAEDLARELHDHAFPEVERALPRGTVPLGAASQIAAIRGIFVMNGRAFEGKTWTICLDDHLSLPISPLYRTLFVKSLKRLDDLGEALKPYAGKISTIGYAAPKMEIPLIHRLARTIRASRMCAIGAMQFPSVNPFHDGICLSAHLQNHLIDEFVP